MATLVRVCGLAAALGSAAAVTNNNTFNGAISTFQITDCSSCISKGTVFCTQAASNANFVSNATMTYSITQKIADVGSVNGVKYCWSGAYADRLSVPRV